MLTVTICNWHECNRPGVVIVGQDGDPKELGIFCDEHAENRLNDELGAVVVAECPNCQCKIAVQP